MKIEMIGYNDSKAIAIYGNIKMLPFLIGSFVISCLCLIPIFVFKIYELLYVFIFPVFLLLLMIFQYVVNCCTKGFLKEENVKHKFYLDDGKFYKDGKEIKSISEIRLYMFKNFIILELKKSYYRILNDDYILGSREDFISQLWFRSKHYVAFKLPPKTKEEIVTLVFSEIKIDGKERLFYSQNKMRIIYIFKNSVGSYSIGREKITILDDEERYYFGKYGFWEPDNDLSISFYGTIEEALVGIENEISNYIELK